MVIDLDKHIAIGNELIVYSKSNIQTSCDLKIRYRIDKENKEIRLYDVPRILTFQEKSIIYYAILDKYYFYPLKIVNREYMDSNIETYIVRENGYTYHEFNNIEEASNGILGELLFEIPRQEMEVEKLTRIRDIYELLKRNINEIGIRPICIAFNGIMPDFKDVFNVIQYIFKYDEKISSKSERCNIFKRSGLLGNNKRIFIIPNRKSNG